jgi:hypothetical protein
VLVPVQLAVADVLHVGEVEESHSVGARLGAHQPLYLGGETGVRRGELEVRVIEQAQVHLVQGQQLARRALLALGLAELHQALRLEAKDAGVLVAVQRVGDGRGRQRQGQGGEKGS